MDAGLLPDFLGYKDLADAGLTRRQFDRLIDAEEYERIAPGQFLRAGATDDTTAAWMAVASKRPQATLCLLTALSIHDLTDEIPTRSNIASPRGMKPLAAWSAPINWHHFDAATFDIGRTEYALPGGRTIGLYSASAMTGAVTSQSTRLSVGSVPKGTARHGCSLWPRTSRRGDLPCRTLWRFCYDTETTTWHARW